MHPETSAFIQILLNEVEEFNNKALYGITWLHTESQKTLNVFFQYLPHYPADFG